MNLDPSRIDWNHLSDTDLAEIQTFITENLTKREIAEIDFRTTGNILLAWSKSISVETNKILQTISTWIDDPAFMDKYRIQDMDSYDWAQYKQLQRQFTADQKQALAERMREAWKEIRSRKQLRDEMSGIIPPRSEALTLAPYDHEDDFILGSSELMGAFSPIEQNKADLEFEFETILTKHLSDIIPWKAVILSELKSKGMNNMTFDEFQTYTSYERIERTARFMHLLQMESDQILTLHQDKHLAPITVIPIHCGNQMLSDFYNSCTTELIDRKGNQSNINMLMLSNAERMSLINQAVNADVIIR